jgi:hypothetical protein
MKKPKITSLLITFVFLTLSSCQNLTTTPSPTQTAIKITTTPQPATETATATPTLIPVPPEALAGLIVSSPILGSPHEVPGMRPTEIITPNGLGMISSQGELIQFSDGGLFKGFSPSGRQIVYQHGFEDEYTDRIDSLYVYHVETGETTEIVENLEEEGGKVVLAWSRDEQTFIYYNDYLDVLFEAWGYFGARQLLSADVATGRTKLLINDGYQFDVSPDRTHIAYTTGKILDAKTSNEESSKAFGCFQPRIYSLASFSSQPFDVSRLDEKPVCTGYPTWSPDGKQIAWIGYFEDDTFRPVIFNLQNKAGRIYPALYQKPKSSRMPTRWYFGETDSGIQSDPHWVDNTAFWTPSYEVNVETDQTSTPREIDFPYRPGREESIQSPDGLFTVSLNEERDTLVVHDTDKKVLAAFLLDDLYHGPKLEILTSPFVLPGVTRIIDWSPFIPAPTKGDN